MYLTFYDLNKKPFQISADPMFLWMGEKHQEALAILKYGIMDNRGFIMLTGDVGTGKTTLINALKETLDSKIVIASISNPGLEKMDFLNFLSVSIGLKKTFRNKGEFLLGFEDFLEQNYRDGKKVLLIIDEAQQLNQEMLEEIRLLSNIERQDVKLLNIFFVGQDEFNSILDRYENRALRQRMTLHYHLAPLSQEEVGMFIDHRLKVAGAKSKIFKKNAVAEIYTYSKGYPRLINIICDHALLAGYVANKKTIGAAEIRDCANDLKLPKIDAPAPLLRTPSPTPNGETAPSPKKQENGRSLDLVSLLTYGTGLLLVVLLICLIYFPIRDGFSFSGVLNYWTNQIRQPKLAISKKIKAIPTEPQATFRVTQKVNHENTQRSKSLNTGTSESPETETGKPDNILNGAQENRMGDNGTAVPTLTDKTTPSADTRIPYPSEEMASPEPGDDSSEPSDIPVYRLSDIPESEKRYHLTFEFDSNDLPSEGYEQLDKTASLMQSYPEITLIIEGHTDAAGSKSYNVILSKFRADIVKNYLIAKGVDPERITAVGKGAEDPLSASNDATGRRTNRRVEIELLF